MLKETYSRPQFAAFVTDDAGAVVWFDCQYTTEDAAEAAAEAVLAGMPDACAVVCCADSDLARDAFNKFTGV